MDKNGKNVEIIEILVPVQENIQMTNVYKPMVKYLHTVGVAFNKTKQTVPSYQTSQIVASLHGLIGLHNVRNPPTRKVLWFVELDVFH